MSTSRRRWLWEEIRMMVVCKVKALRTVVTAWLKEASSPGDSAVVSVQGDYVVVRRMGADAAFAVCAQVKDRSYSAVLKAETLQDIQQFLSRLGPDVQVRFSVGLAGPEGARVKTVAVRSGAQMLRLVCG